MELTETIDFENQPASSCCCAEDFIRCDDPTRDATGTGKGSTNWCPVCNQPTNGAADSIDNLTELLDEDVFESARAHFVPDALIGQQLSEFLIQERVGSGGMARVYLAHDTVLQRHVAVKVIQNRKFVSTESQAAALKSEAVSQAQLHHPNVVSIFHVGNHDDVPFLAMEYVDGCSLADRLKQETPISFAETLDYARQIVAGLSEAYSQGLIHGDIKPANLLVSDDGTLKLSDFGLARRAEEQREVAKKLIGTPSFMAPELFSNHPIDEQTDLFSLGVTLFQLTFGRAPYLLEGETAEEVKHEIEISEIDFPDRWPSDLPLKWKSLLEKLLAKDRSQRYSSVDQVKADIADLSKPVLVVKPITRISALISENLLYFFLLLPLLTSMVNLGPSANLGAILGSYLWSLGPLSLFAISAIRRKSVIQSVFQLRMIVDASPENSLVGFLKGYAFQLAPIITFLAGVLLIPQIGTVAALGALWTAVVIGGFQIVDIVVNRHQATLTERWGRCRIVVDQ